MLKTVKIGEAEYRAMKALAKQRGMLLQRLLNDAIQLYLKSQKAEA